MNICDQTIPQREKHLIHLVGTRMTRKSKTYLIRTVDVKQHFLNFWHQSGCSFHQMESVDRVGGVTFRIARIGTAQIVVKALQVIVNQHLDVTVI